MSQASAPSPSRAELEAAHCWDPSDVVARKPAMTAFRQATRLHHARWREARGLPIGSQPFRARAGAEVRPVGNRLALAFAEKTGASLLTPAALEAARRRMSFVEHDQSIDRQRLWADLLASEALAFNLFGDLAADLRRADRAVHAWAPDAPGRVTDVRFAHSPGRLDPEWLNSLRAFDAAFVLDRGDGTRGILAVDVKYHERLTVETPKPQNLWRYREVHERSEAFRPEAFEALHGRSDLWSPWLEQLLLFSMLQHPSGEWTWGRYALVHPTDNVDMVDLCARYRDLLTDPSTFLPLSLEEVIGGGVLPRQTSRLLRERYVAA
ncbi:MAG TPA: hypothetical protein VFI34_06700 [Candidatus Limnocylindrales bacterium]|nr:hypothetical protein [Candidatus Limnocylindrales bacterium]